MSNKITLSEMTRLYLERKDRDSKLGKKSLSLADPTKMRRIKPEDPFKGKGLDSNSESRRLDPGVFEDPTPRNNFYTNKVGKTRHVWEDK